MAEVWFGGLAQLGLLWLVSTLENSGTLRTSPPCSILPRKILLKTVSAT